MISIRSANRLDQTKFIFILQTGLNLSSYVGLHKSRCVFFYSTRLVHNTFHAMANFVLFVILHNIRYSYALL